MANIVSPVTYISSHPRYVGPHERLSGLGSSARAQKLARMYTDLDSLCCDLERADIPVRTTLELMKLKQIIRCDADYPPKGRQPTDPVQKPGGK